jgi:hypothetical protein
MDKVNKIISPREAHSPAAQQPFIRPRSGFIARRPFIRNFAPEEAAGEKYCFSAKAGGF